MTLKGKTLFITGASRGIGLEIALAAARDGANVAIVAKTVTADPKLPGTIYTAAEDVIKAGGKALAIQCDIRFEDQVQKAIDQTVEAFGGIDIVVNNASAISLTNTEETTLKKFDLMNQINGRGTWLVSKLAIPHLKKSAQLNRNPHILVLCPPPDLRPMWFSGHVGYTMAKYAMSLCVIGLSGELQDDGIAVNGLWPLTAIDTSAMHNVIDKSGMAKNRKATIMADAAYAILNQPSVEYTGNFAIDEVVLRFQGVTNFDRYKVDPACPDDQITMDFFLPENPYHNAITLPKIIPLQRAKL
jgi:citronellol/citronellal dehydrogenase